MTTSDLVAPDVEVLPGRCLIIDDEAQVRSALARVLATAGHAVFEAESASQALAELERGEFHLVISDMRMPVMDGKQLLKRIRERWPDTAVIMLTGVTDVSSAMECLHLGAFDYIPKPFELSEVRARAGQALEKRRLILENRAYQQELESRVRVQAQRIERLFLEGVQTLAHALEAKDAYTRGHSARVSAYAVGIARALDLPDAQVSVIELGGELHDVGKIGVREEVLNKPGPLTDDEYQHIMDHTVIGERILRPLLHDQPELLAMVRSHHERVDGRGFPDGLIAARIPLEAKIIAVADTFDAMTTARPYRRPRTTPDALQELRVSAGAQLDPNCVAAFFTAFPDPAGLPISAPETTASVTLHSA